MFFQEIFHVLPAIPVKDSWKLFQVHLEVLPSIFASLSYNQSR